MKSNSKLLIITSCSAKKKSYRTTAADLYQGQLFKMVKKLSRINEFDYRIFSAKYGLIKPDKVIKPYEKTISNKTDIIRLNNRVMPKFLDLTKQYKYILLIMGSKYREVLKENKLDNVYYIKADKGIGDYLKVVSKLLNYNKYQIYKIMQITGDRIISYKNIQLFDSSNFTYFNSQI